MSLLETLMQQIGSMVCALSKHQWKRNRANLMKHCKRCGKVAAIKKRAVK